MITFSYKAIDTGGHSSEGSLEAINQEAAIAKLKEMKLSPISISQISSKKSKTKLLGSKKITKMIFPTLPQDLQHC